MSCASQPLTASAKPDSLLASDHFIAWLLAAAALLLQMLTNGRYGYFRDELYFLACSNHLAWGYVDFAPLVALLARISCFTLGDSLHAIRTLPALAQAAEILITGILAGTYGDAGAIDLFGPHYNLPKSISPHQNYYYWGPRQYTGEALILLHYDLVDAQRWCQSVQIGPTLNNPYAIQEEHYTILVCRGARLPLVQAWPGLKVWN